MNKYKRENLKLLAIVILLIDHFGVFLFPGVFVMRLVGRLGFPIYAYLVVTGYRLTRDTRNYYNRLMYFAFLSQIGFMLCGLKGLNVIFLFCWFVAFQICIENKRYFLASIPTLCVFLFPAEFGVFGFVLMLSFYYFDLSVISFCLIFFFSFLIDFPFQWLSSFSVPLIYFCTDYRFKIPPVVWRYFYPVHWFILRFLCGI